MFPLLCKKNRPFTEIGEGAVFPLTKTPLSIPTGKEGAEGGLFGKVVFFSSTADKMPEQEDEPYQGRHRENGQRHMNP